MTYTLRILKLPERLPTEPAQTFDTLEEAFQADDYAIIVGASFVAQITDDDTDEVVRERQIVSDVKR